MQENKIKIAFFIGNFPKISESWFIEQLTALLDMGLDIDIFAFDRGEAKDISDLVLKYQLLDKTTYLEFPKNHLRRICLIIKYFFKILILKPNLLLKIFRYGCKSGDIFSGKYLLYVGPLLNKIDKYQVIHCHFGMIANRYLKIREIMSLEQKLITTFYGQDSSKYIKAKGLRVYDSLKKYCDIFLLMTEEMKERFIKLGFPKEKLFVHYTGLNINHYNFQQRKYDGKDIFRIVSVGRFVEKKGFEDLLRAVAIVFKNFPKIELNVVGGGDDEYFERLLDLAKNLGLSKNVIFHGMISHDEMIGLLSRVHLMVQLSKTAQDGDTDDLPFVLLEGQMTGLPVISTRHVGIPDGIMDGNSGFLVPEGDFNAAADKILYFINQSNKISEFSLFAHNFVKNKFNLSKINSDLKRIYYSNK